MMNARSREPAAGLSGVARRAKTEAAGHPHRRRRVRCAAGVLILAIFATTAMAAAAVSAAEVPDDRADRLWKRWDRNGDGRLTPEELPEGVRRNFDRVDRDGDGVISREEHRAVAARRRRQPDRKPPDLSRQWPNVEATYDVPYAGTDNPRQRLDLYLPKERRGDGPLPLVVFIHGGAWRAGDKRGGVRMVAPHADTGRFAGASVGYRLSGEAIWPAQIHDCKAAIRWLKANAGKYNLDPDRLAVWGSSAGGHLVAMLGLTADVPELEGTLGPHTDRTSRVTCVVDWFGPSEFLHMNDEPGSMDHLAANSPESLLIGCPIAENKDKARAVSPVTYVSKGDAPHLIMHGDKDRTVPHDQSVRLAAALEKAGVPCTFVTIKGAGHGFGGPEIHERVRLFLEKHLLGADVEVSAEAIESPP
jgi:acetyl esterase/lipase